MIPRPEHSWASERTPKRRSKTGRAGREGERYRCVRRLGPPDVWSSHAVKLHAAEHGRPVLDEPDVGSGDLGDSRVRQSLRQSVSEVRRNDVIVGR